MVRNIIDSGGSISPATSKATIRPVENATRPFWRSQPHALDEFRSTKDLPTECDILIIGAGMSGVATAYFLTKIIPKAERPSIVLLEARQLCSGATARNGGHAKVKTSTLQAWTKQYGEDFAAEMADVVDEQIHLLKLIVEREGLDCEFELRRTYDVFYDGHDAETAMHDFHASLWRGQRWTRDVSVLNESMAEQVTSVRGAKGALGSNCASFWPYKFVSQLAARLIDEDCINLQTNTPVYEVSQDEKSQSQVVSTPRGSIKARKVVFATNGYTAGISPTYLNTIVPTVASASHLVPENPVSPHLSQTYNLHYGAATGTDYLNPRPDGGIVVGGAKWTYEADRSRWYNVCDDSKQIPEVYPHFDGLMQRTFRGWEGSDARVESVWTGIQGSTPDELPHVGEVPGSGGRQYILAGFNGGGMAFICMCARAVAKMIRDEVEFEGTGLPLLLKTTRKRLVE